MRDGLPQSSIDVCRSAKYPPEQVKIYLDGVQRVPKGAKPLTESPFTDVMLELVACLKQVGGRVGGGSTSPGWCGCLWQGWREG